MKTTTGQPMANVCQGECIYRYHRHLSRLHPIGIESAARLWIATYARLWRERFNKDPQAAVDRALRRARPISNPLNPLNPQFFHRRRLADVAQVVPHPPVMASASDEKFF